MASSPLILSICLLLSLAVLFFIASRNFSPKPLPISLPDELSDLSLFRQATAAATGKPSSSKFRLGKTNPKPKIAFLFLTNSDLTFAPLWEKFFKTHSNLYNIYIHADPSVKLTPPGGVFTGRFIPAKKTERSSPTLISAARRLMANAILDDPMNLYFALVSQHCIPLHSFRFVYDSIFGNSINALKAFSTQSKHKSYIEILSQDPYLHNRYTSRGDNVMLPEIPFSQFRVGSQFFILAKRHALIVLRDRKLWKKFMIPCLNVNSCYPEEHYFPTLLSMKDPKGCSHFTLTRVNWTDSTGGHPHTYYPPEVSPELVYTLRQSNSSYSYFFARKFSPGCLKPLMEIADDVIFRD